MNGVPIVIQRLSVWANNAVVIAASGLVILAAALTLMTGQASAQSGPTVSAEPATDLVDGQAVTVTAAPGSAQQLYIVRQCAENPVSFGDCDEAMLGYVESGHSNGSPFSFRVPVYRELDLSGGTRDCAVENCVLALTSTGQDFSVAATAAISFDPSVAPTPRPVITVAPSTDLMDGEVVSIEGSGFGPFERVYLRQCGPGGSESGCGDGQRVITELDGTFTNQLAVTRLVPGNQWLSQIDCAVETCRIVVQGYGRSASPAALSFDPEAPIELGPTVKVRPRKNLKDGAAVSVTVFAEEGESLMPYASVLQCALTSAGLIDADTCRYVGDFSSDREDGPSPATTLAPSPTPVPENPPPTTGPPTPAPPTTDPPTVPPTTGPPGIVPPATTEPAPFAPLTSSAAAALDHDTGIKELSGTVQVRRSLFIERHGQDSRRIDCVEVKCVVAVQANGSQVWRSQILKFDPASTAPKPVVKINGRNGLVSGMPLTIQIKKTRAVFIEIRQCPRTATTHLDHRCQQIGFHYRGERHSPQVPILGLKPFTVQAVPVRFVGNGSDQVDCREPKACDLRVFGSDGPMRRLLINFAEDGSPLAEKFRLAERKDLKNREPVAIKVGKTGRGWSLQQCPDGSGGTGCVGVRVQDKVEENGVTRGTVSLRRVIGGVDCATSESRCQLRLLLSHRETDRVLLRFNPSVPGDPDPVFEAKPRRGLVDGQFIRLTSRATRGSFITYQCVRDDEGNNGACRYLVQARPSDTDDIPGTRERMVEVRRYLGEVDCAESAGRCRLVMRRGSDQELGVINLRFDPDAPPRPAFAATVRPRKGLADGQSVKVSFTASEAVAVRQCAIVNDVLLEESCVNPRLSGFTEEDGIRKASATVARHIGPSGVETLFDCADIPRSCVMVFTNYVDHGESIVERQVSLVFDRNAPPVTPEEPETTGYLFLDREGPIEIGSILTLIGEGFTPGIAMFVLPCPVDFADGNDCDTGSLTPVTVDGDGMFAVEVEFRGCGDERCRFAVGDPAGTEIGFTEPFDVIF